MDYLLVIAVKYALFAIASIIVNILCQYLSLLVYIGVASLYVAMLAGTLAGLISKYILDKKYIFHFTSASRLHDAERFFHYSVTGIFTTAIFWSTEIGFDLAFEGDFAKYIGAVIGLSVGYFSKYFLDKRYVFKEHAP